MTIFNIEYTTTTTQKGVTRSKWQHSLLDGKDYLILGGLYEFATDEGVSVLDISNPILPVLKDKISLGNYLSAMYVTGSLIYAANTNGQFSVIDWSTPTNMSRLGWVVLPHSMGADYGMAGQGAYIYTCGWTNYLMTIDVRDSAHPVWLSEIKYATDYPIDVAVDSNKLYVTTNTSLLVYDVRDFPALHGLGSVSIPSTPYVSGHIVINQNRAYISRPIGHTITVVDITNPAAMSVLGTINDATYLSYNFDFRIIGNSVYTVNRGTNPNYLTKWDASDPAGITRVESIALPTSTYYQSLEMAWISDRPWFYCSSGDDWRLTVVSDASPFLGDTYASDIRWSSAVLNSEILSTGGLATEFRFVWGLTTTYNKASTWTSGGVGAILAIATRLRPQTTYHFRAEARNSEGTTVSDDYTFTTLPGVDFKVEIAVNQPLFAEVAAEDWTDITDDVMSLNIKRGRMHELDRVEAGTATITLNNASGDYWRYNPASPYNSGTPLYTPYFKPLLLIKVTGSYEDTDCGLFYGYIESIAASWVEDRGGKTPTMNISCVDFFKTFARWTLSNPANNCPAEPTGTRIIRILRDQLGFPESMLSVSEGTVKVAALTPLVGGTNLLEHLQDIAEAECGIIFMSGSGLLTFQDKNYRLVYENTSKATFTDSGSNSQYVLPEIVDDDTFIYNEARIKTVAGVEQIYYDINYVAEQGERAKVNTNSILDSDADVFDQCYLLVERYKDSILRCKSLLLLPAANPSDLILKTLSYEISSRITLILDNGNNVGGLPATGTGFPMEYHIEGIEHEWDAETNIWQPRWQLWDVNQFKMFRADSVADPVTGHADWVRKHGLLTLGYPATHDAADASDAYKDHTDTEYDPPDDLTGGIIVGQWDDTVSYHIGRGYLEFDTSLLLSTDSVVSAQLLLKTHLQSTAEQSFDLTIVDSLSVTHAGFSVSDYGVIGGSDYEYGHIGIDNTILGKWIAIDITDTSLLQAEGTTRLALRSSRDISSTPPDYILNTPEYLSIYGSAGDGGTPNIINAPRLMIKVRKA